MISIENEKLTIVDEGGHPIGTATRAEVHRKGYWHETFQCWMYEKSGGRIYLYFQLRSPEKKDYPNLLDITAAGHLLAGETPEEGLREIEEELGLSVKYNDLHSLGIIKDCGAQENFIDNERAHVFLYKFTGDWSVFRLQLEEVVGMLKVDLEAFRNLWEGTATSVRMEGFKTNHSGAHMPITEKVGKGAFVPHDARYYLAICDGINDLEG